MDWKKQFAASSFPSHPFAFGLKMMIDDDGIYQLKGSDLRKAGMLIDKIESRYYKLYCNSVEIPLFITNNTKTYLANNDVILFYAKGLRGTTTRYTQFSFSNAYWLTWQNNYPGIRMTEASGAIRKDVTVYQGGNYHDVNAHDFLDTIHLEQDNDIRWLGSVTIPREMTDSADGSDTVDNWYWTFVGQNDLTDVSINVPSPTLSTDASYTARIRIALQGLSANPQQQPDHRLYIYLNDNQMGGQQQIAQWNGQSAYEFVSTPFSSAELKNGTNKLTFSKIIPGQNSSSTTDLSSLNWIEIEYYRTFTVTNNIISFKNSVLDTLGICQFTLHGFTSTNCDVWDLTTNRILSGYSNVATVQNGSTTYSLVFQDSITAIHSYIAQTIDKRLSPKSALLDTIKTDWQFAANADYVVVTVDSFFTDFKPFVSAYAKKGITVALVDISDIYNAFSYGIRDPESIRTLLTYLFGLLGAKPPRFLLLGGDTTHDLDKNRGDRNIVPTHLSRVPGWGPSSDDSYFSLIVGDDNFPDIYVGRFPAENRLELQSLVDKTVKYLTEPQTGPWHDNLLLASGADPDFTSFTNNTEDEIVGSAMNVLRLDADPASRYYRDVTTATKTIADYINAGVYAVNFDGHGGGNVWSDSRFFSYTDLPKLYNGQWGNSGRLPFVFSFTCLTGFFESAFYPSLGEEFVRLPKHGAIGFFGASAYTSKDGNFFMNREFLDNAMHNNFESVGELLWLTKMNMLVRYGAEYLPLIREYNFLGDPALPWTLAPDSLNLSLSQTSISQQDTFALRGVCTGLGAGTAKVTIGADHDVWKNYSWHIATDTFTGSARFKDSIQTSNGIVRAFAWNDSMEMRGHASFSKSKVMFSHLTLTPPQIHYGDSVTISVQLSMPDTSYHITAVFCLYAITQRSISDPAYQGVAMFTDSTGAWRTNTKMPITFDGAVGEELLVKFRVIGNKTADSTSVSAFPILGRPDLQFTGKGIGLFWQNDSLFVKGEIVNAGNATCPPFTVSFYTDTNISTTPVATIRIADSLSMGKARQIGVSLPDLRGKVTITVIANQSAAFNEIDMNNNTAILKTDIGYADLSTQTDTLFSPRRGVCISPASHLSVRHRVFLLTDTVSATQPLQTQSSWLPLTGDSVMQFRMYARPALTNADSVQWQFHRDTSVKTSPQSGKMGVFGFDTVYAHWRYTAGTADALNTTYTMLSISSQRFALGLTTDMTSPTIRASVYGRELTFLDYAAKDKPFNLQFSDASGIVPSSVKLLINKQPFDSTLMSKLPASVDLRELSCTAYPPKQNSIDSLAVQAQDFAGNTANVVFAYMPGEDLQIKYFSCHPNPFSAKQDNSSKTIQTIRFAFFLTDVAKQADLTIYTIGNRSVWKWQQTDGIIGYQEVPWDGKTSQGYRIANGTYYAKLTIKSDSKTITQIIRIAKLEGY